MSTAYVYTDLLRRRHIMTGSVRVRPARCDRRDRFGVCASLLEGQARHVSRPLPFRDRITVGAEVGIALVGSAAGS
jgi:hypothetical protein